MIENDTFNDYFYQYNVQVDVKYQNRIFEYNADIPQRGELHLLFDVGCQIKLQQTLSEKKQIYVSKTSKSHDRSRCCQNSKVQTHDQYHASSMYSRYNLTNSQ